MRDDKEPQEESQENTAPKKNEIEPVKPEKSEEREIPPEVIEVIEKLPPDDRKKIRSIISSMSAVSVRSFGPPHNPLLDKMTPEHVDKVLDHIAEESQRDTANLRQSRKYNFWYFIVGLIAFFALLVYLVSQQQKDLLVPLAVALLGFLGGYGIGKAKK